MTRQEKIIRVMAVAVNPFVLIINIGTAIVIAVVQTYKDNVETMRNLW